MREYVNIALHWLLANKTPILWSVAAFAISFVTMGLPGALVYFPATWAFKGTGHSSVRLAASTESAIITILDYSRRS